jgi:iron complex transport system ATP-binding protein
MELKADKLILDYGSDPIIENFSLDVKAGEIITLIGSNGSGKSTVLKAMGRTLKPSRGAVYLDGKALLSYDTKALARKMAMLPQSHNTPADLTVRDLVAYGRFPHSGIFRASGSKDKEAVDKALYLTQLEELQDRFVSTLSGGERQRAWIALNLAQEPSVLLLDEPTTFLDISHQFELLELVSDMNRNMGIAIVMVLHDLNHAARYSDRIIAIKNKGIYCSGTVKEVMTEKNLREIFNIKTRIIHEDGIPHFIPIGSCARASKFEPLGKESKQKSACFNVAEENA